VTNNHVVDGASKLRVKLNDGRTFDAKVIGKDSATDLALLKVDAKELPTLAFGSSDALRLGEWVLAIGSPFDLQSTITAGIVSAKARNLGVIPNDFRIEAFIQTDAAVNPGNSGGALVNTHGELVGINTLIKSQTGSYIGYSFAIPESIVRKVVMDLKEFGVVQRALLGVEYRIVDQDFIDQMGEETGIKEIGGAYVARIVEGGSASEAGLRKGDIILDIDGVKINDGATLSEQVGRRRPNDKVKLSIKRDGKVKQIDVTLRNKAGKTELVTKEDVDVIDALGGKFADAGTKLCQQLDIKGGVQVVGIKADGILARARVKQGFVITHINDRPVYAVSDMHRMTEKVRSIDGIYPNGRAASYTLVE
jgi:periplasmic serine protease, Do/deqQ family